MFSFKSAAVGAAIYALTFLGVDMVKPVKQFTDTAKEIYSVSYNIEDFCSATAIDEERKLLATAAHCIFKYVPKDEIGYFNNVIYIVWQGDKAYKAILYKMDKTADVAVLQIIEYAPDFRAADVNLTPMVGEDVYCMGNAKGILDSNLTKGIVSSLNRKLPWTPGIKVIGLDCVILEGNSGGGAFDSQGRLIAVNVATFGVHVPNLGGLTEGYTMAIPVREVLKLIHAVN